LLLLSVFLRIFPLLMCTVSQIKVLFHTFKGSAEMDPVFIFLRKKTGIPFDEIRFFY